MRLNETHIIINGGICYEEARTEQREVPGSVSGRRRREARHACLQLLQVL